MRRYASPDENPFNSNLPEPLLPALSYPENPLRPNSVNINPQVLNVYVGSVVPAVCAAGDDGQYGSTSVCDVMCLQALSRRIHYGKFVAESKIQRNPGRFRDAVVARDKDRLMDLVTDDSVESEVISRVRHKAELYGQLDVGEAAALRIDPAILADIYREWVIPLNKHVQIEYLLQRGV
jgi:chorismate mutase